MSGGRASVILPTSPQRAFESLANPQRIGDLVVGARRIRRFDARWPEAGAQLHHSVGVPPLVIRDTTVAIECVADRRLVLKARVWGAGIFVATFELSPHPGGTLLSVHERAVGGLAALSALRPAVHLLLGARNALLCRRFRRLAESRERLIAAEQHA